MSIRASGEAVRGHEPEPQAGRLASRRRALPLGGGKCAVAGKQIKL